MQIHSELWFGLRKAFVLNTHPGTILEIDDLGECPEFLGAVGCQLVPCPTEPLSRALVSLIYLLPLAFADYRPSFN